LLINKTMNIQKYNTALAFLLIWDDLSSGKLNPKSEEGKLMVKALKLMLPEVTKKLTKL